MNDATRTRLLKLLEEDREQQVDLLRELGADPDSEAIDDLRGEDGFADSAQATASRSETLALIDQARARLHQVDEALARMGDGSYGVCGSCGQPIDAARLEIRPLSVLCVSCATKAEAEAG